MILNLDQAYANLVIEVFKNLIQKIKISYNKKWLMRITEWSGEDNIWFQAIYEYDLFDEQKTRDRIKLLSIERLRKISTCR